MRAPYSVVTLKTGLRELVRECFKVKSVVINRLGIGSSSPWILFEMKGTSRSSTLYFDPFIRNPQTSTVESLPLTFSTFSVVRRLVRGHLPVYFSRLKLYFDSNDCEDRNATQFSGEMFFICSRS